MYFAYKLNKQGLRAFASVGRIFFFFFFYLCWIFVAAHRLSLVVVSRCCSVVAMSGFLIAVASFVGEHGL